MMVAVGFNPRLSTHLCARRGATTENNARDVQASLRDAALGHRLNRGLKPTATISSSLRDDPKLAKEMGVMTNAEAPGYFQGQARTQVRQSRYWQSAAR
jgi:hypothetical protein